MRHMIANHPELKATRERIDQFQRWLIEFRRTARPEQFNAVTSGYRLEIERVQAEVMGYRQYNPVRSPVVL